VRCFSSLIPHAYAYSFHSTTSKSPLSSSRGATLPVFIRKDTTQKRDSFDSFSDMSASYGGISPLEYDGGEKAGTLTLGDVSDVTTL
jgi:hypothetical protein